MQRKLLEALLQNDRLNRHQYFVTTHSNHMLDMAADYSDCSTYLVRKSATDPTICNVHSIGSRDRLLLQELGARASSVFLTNATIWVDGPTDRLYIRQYLNRYFRDTHPKVQLNEDTHYSFMLCGGSSVTNFDYDENDEDSDNDTIKVANICSTTFLVLDGDNATKKKGERVARLRDQLRDRLMLLESKEIENLTPPTVLKAYVRHRNADADVDKITLDGYHKHAIPLGKYLDQQLGTQIFTYENTIKNKKGFCDFCIKYMKEQPAGWDLTPEAAELCQRLAAFIAQANGKQPKLNPDGCSS
jgi:predicted ATP-dependent endonuclease of OLD family